MQLASQQKKNGKVYSAKPLQNFLPRLSDYFVIISDYLDPLLIRITLRGGPRALGTMNAMSKSRYYWEVKASYGARP